MSRYACSSMSVTILYTVVYLSYIASHAPEKNIILFWTIAYSVHLVIYAPAHM